MKINNLFFELGYHCNSNCDYCFQKELSKDMKKGFLTAEQVVDFLKTLPLDDKAAIMFFGGESLLYLDVIIEIIEKAKKENITFIPKITTNGILLEGSALEKLIQYKIEPTISLDGAPYTQTCHRSIGKQSYKDFYSKIYHAISIFHKNQIPVACQSTFTPKTVGNLLETALLVDKIGFDKWWFELECISEYGKNQWNNILLNVFQKQIEQLLYLEPEMKTIILPFDGLRKGFEEKIILYVNGIGEISAGSKLVKMVTSDTANYFVLGKNLHLYQNWQEKIDVIKETINHPIVLSSDYCKTCKKSDFCLWHLDSPLSDLNDCQDQISCEYWRRMSLAEEVVNN